MSAVTAPIWQSALKQLKLLFALSRTPHGVLDIATPAVAALLWYGTFPPLGIIILGLITAFAGYTAVYALNDLVDYRVDKKKLERGGFCDTKDYLDAVLIRHPLACGLLTFNGALLWAGGWALLALAGAYLLNPICVVIFVIACLLETIYCIMWRTSYLRALISGVVKTSGGMAAVFAVDQSPSALFLFLLFFWLFFWEIGGQNTPADWTDIEEDRLLKAKTIPLRLGRDRAKAIIFFSLVMTVALNGILLCFSRVGIKLPAVLAAAGVGIYLLLIPAYRLFKTQEASHASMLFNKASYYPLAMLCVVSILIMI